MISVYSYSYVYINVSSSNFKQSHLKPNWKYCKINKTTLDHWFALFIGNTIVVDLIKNIAYLVPFPEPEFDSAFQTVLTRWGASEKK